MGQLQGGCTATVQVSSNQSDLHAGGGVGERERGLGPGKTHQWADLNRNRKIEGPERQTAPGGGDHCGRYTPPHQI